MYVPMPVPLLVPGFLNVPVPLPVFHNVLFSFKLQEFGLGLPKRGGRNQVRNKPQSGRGARARTRALIKPQSCRVMQVIFCQ